MKVESAHLPIAYCQSDLDNLKEKTRTNGIAEVNKYSILASIQAIEYNMKQLRKLLEA